jgi:calcineurin-like phosphoesterase family protein
VTVFFTSDTHFGHKRIIELANRPFRDIDHMNEMIVRYWNDTVGPDDYVFHCGDVALGPIRESLEIVRRLSGIKILVIGNHDRNFRLGKRSGGLEPAEWDKEYQSYGFDYVVESATVDLGNEATGDLMFNVSHFPYDGDSHDADRFDAARLPDEGVPLIHGHTHSSGYPVTFSNSDTLQVHVGVDAWMFRPVSEHEIRRLYFHAQHHV